MDVTSFELAVVKLLRLHSLQKLGLRLTFRPLLSQPAFDIPSHSLTTDTLSSPIPSTSPPPALLVAENAHDSFDCTGDTDYLLSLVGLC